MYNSGDLESSALQVGELRGAPGPEPLDQNFYVDPMPHEAVTTPAVGTVGVTWAEKCAHRWGRSPHGGINHLSSLLSSGFLLRLQQTVRFMPFLGVLSRASLHQGL